MLPHNGRDSGNECKRRSDNLSSQTKCFDSHLQSKCAIGTSHHTRNIQILSNFFFKALHQRPVMGHDATFPNTFEQFVNFGLRCEGWHGDIDGFIHHQQVY